MTDRALLNEQIAYYRAIADEYGDHPIDAPGGADLIAAFERFPITGDVLELACGPGLWTQRLTKGARSVTAVDAAPEMIARAKALTSESNVRFIQGDLFNWKPDRRYDSVFFGFWLSHVPEDRFLAFWELVAMCVTPDGRVFFVDDGHRATEELIEGPDSPIVQRRGTDGSTYLAIKVPHSPHILERRLRELAGISPSRALAPFTGERVAGAPDALNQTCCLARLGRLLPPPLDLNIT